MAIKLADKGEQFETLYIKDAVLYWGKLNEPDYKYQSKTEKEYSVTVFVNEKDATQLEDDVMINKELKEVGVGKTKKRKIKYDKEKFPGLEKMFGMQLTSPTYSKKGKPMRPVVVMNDEVFTDNIGNGTKAHLKISGYRNQDGMLTFTQISLVKIVDLVEYESTGGSQGIDDELGVSVNVPELQESVPDIGDDFDEDDIPFDN